MICVSFLNPCGTGLELVLARKDHQSDDFGSCDPVGNGFIGRTRFLRHFSNSLFSFS